MLLMCRQLLDDSFEIGILHGKCISPPPFVFRGLVGGRIEASRNCKLCRLNDNKANPIFKIKWHFLGMMSEDSLKKWSQGLFFLISPVYSLQSSSSRILHFRLLGNDDAVCIQKSEISKPNIRSAQGDTHPLPEIFPASYSILKVE